MKLIERARYQAEIDAWLGKGLAIVLTGQRRVGKSMCLKLLAQKVQGDNTNLIYIDKEDHVFDDINTYQELNAYLDSHYKDDQHNYILIDDDLKKINWFKESVRNIRGFR